MLEHAYTGAIEIMTRSVRRALGQYLGEINQSINQLFEEYKHVRMQYKFKQGQLEQAPTVVVIEHLRITLRHK